MGKVIGEVKVASEPNALLAVLRNAGYHFKRIGLEAGPLSQWLFSALAEADLPVICVETRHMRAVLKAQIDKTDRNDARGIAQMMPVGLYRPVHVDNENRFDQCHQIGEVLDELSVSCDRAGCRRLFRQYRTIVDVSAAILPSVEICTSTTRSPDADHTTTRFCRDGTQQLCLFSKLQSPENIHA
jgi:DNA-directed RNA polymerase subunit N (RpoN/RPB10)